MIAELLQNLSTGGAITPPTPPITPANQYASAAPYQARITSEYNKQPQFMAVVGMACSAMADITAVAQTVSQAYDLDQAAGAQLDVVGEWVGQSRVINDVLIPGYFGFSDDPEALPFGEIGNAAIGGEFFDIGDTATTTTVLGDPDYLTVIRARIIRNQSTGITEDIENCLALVFGAQCSVIDKGTWGLSIIVSTPITPTQQALLRNLDILPRPAIVSIDSISFSGLPQVPAPLAGVRAENILASWTDAAASWRAQGGAKRRAS